MLTGLHFDTNRLLGGGVEVLLMGKVETSGEIFCHCFKDALLSGRAQLVTNKDKRQISFISDGLEISFSIKEDDFLVVDRMIKLGNIQIEDHSSYVGDDHCGGIAIIANG